MSDAAYIHVVRGAVVCWALVNAAMKIRDPQNTRNFLISSCDNGETRSDTSRNHVREYVHGDASCAVVSMRTQSVPQLEKNVAFYLLS